MYTCLMLGGDKAHSATIPALSRETQLFFPLKLRVTVLNSVILSQQCDQYVSAFSEDETLAWARAWPSPERSIHPACTYCRPSFGLEEIGVVAPEIPVSSHSTVIDL
jgi:hypothetical protein